jgi:DNA-binding NarL/FixJ family response regulator
MLLPACVRSGAGRLCLRAPCGIMGLKDIIQMNPSSTSPANPSIHPLRVLLVDDSPVVRHDLSQLLTLAGGIQIAGEAENGLQACQLCAQLLPDVVVMDLEMPILDGLEATRRIKVLTPAPWVVVLSVHAGPVVEELARAAGADRFIEKGSDYQTLVNAIRGMNGSNHASVKGE